LPQTAAEAVGRSPDYASAGGREAARRVRAEEASSHGRADMVVSLGNEIFILDFKTAAKADEAASALAAALTQIRERGYAEKYRGRPVHRIAVACGREARNLLEVRAERDRNPT